MHHQKRGFVPVLLLLIALVALGGGVVYVKRNNIHIPFVSPLLGIESSTQDSASSTFQPTNDMKVTIPSFSGESAMIEYKDSKSGFSFMYPRSWGAVMQATAENDPIDFVGKNDVVVGFANGLPIMVGYVQDAPDDKNPIKHIESEKGRPGLVTLTHIVVDGHPALRAEMDSPFDKSLGKMTQVYVPDNNNTNSFYFLTNLGFAGGEQYLADFDKLVQSFKIGK